MARVDVSWQNFLIVGLIAVAFIFVVKWVNGAFPNPVTGIISSAV